MTEKSITSKNPIHYGGIKLNDNNKVKTANPHACSWRMRYTAAPLALLMAAANITPAFATIDNTVTATGTPPSGPAGSVISTATENVDVADATPTLTVVKAWSFAPGGDINNNGLVDAGDVIAYTYTVTNTGNVTLADVATSDAHDGTGAPLVVLVPASVTTDNGTAGDSTDVPVPADGDWDTLGVGDVITFTSTYTVVAGDLTAPTSADGDIDNTATVTGNYNPGTGNLVVNDTSSTFVPLNIVPALSVSKVADDDTNVVVGQVVVYTYTVTNNGNVPLTNVTLADTHNGIPGALVPAFVTFTTNTGSTNTGNTINVLQPGDVATYTASYTVTQNDIDTRQ